MTHLAHIILNVSDFEVSTKFYNSLFSQLHIPSRVVEDLEDIKITAYDITDAPLYIRWSKDEVKNSFVRNTGLDHIAIGVDTREEVDNAHNLIMSLGTKITQQPKAYPEYTDNYYAFYFRDPDGIPFEIVYM